MEQISQIFTQWSGITSFDIALMPASGSSRKYYRIKSETLNCLGVWNNDIKENIAFIDYTKQLAGYGINVPQILFEATTQNCYFIEDLADTTLYSCLLELRKDGTFPDKLYNIYKAVINELAKIQIVAGEKFNYDNAYPRKAFDKQSMIWDLNYFKYHFLKLAKVSFDEQLLENDFNKLCDYLAETPSNYFLYRDFQSRNIMLVGHKIYFIDYQGGREGALQYDIASLLYDAKADIPQPLREQLLREYISVVKRYLIIDDEDFLQRFYAFVFIRIMQAMGSYGYRGYYERKEHFLKSIPYALNNLDYLLNHHKLVLKLPELERVFRQLLADSSLHTIDKKQTSLTLCIKSFSFKKGYPQDDSGNGGGFVFDCRALPNPGRYEEYKQLTGNDQKVITYFKQYKDVELFVDKTIQLVESSIYNYMERGFVDLAVSFGCTGGQHRSVYCANLFAKKIKEKFNNLNVELQHQEYKN